MSRDSSRGRALGCLLAPFGWLAAPIRQPRRALLCMASAGCVVLSFPPFNVWPLLFVSLVPLLFAIRGLRPGQAFGWGLLTGLAITAVGFYFIATLLQVFGGLPLGVAIVLHLLFSLYQGTGIALFAALAAGLSRRGWPMALVAPVTYTAAEVLCREYTIFPWYLSNATYSFLPLIQAADLFGGLGLTAVLVLVNAAVFEVVRALVERRGGRPVRIPRASPAVAGGVLLAVLVYGVVRIGQVDAVAASQPTLKVGLVEADIGIYAKEDPEKILNNMLIHQQLSADLAARGADLIIWPETAAKPPAFAISRARATDLETLRDTVEVVEHVPRDVTWFRPSEAPLVEDFRQDLAVRRPIEDMVGIQRGFHTPLLFGVLTVSEPSPEEARSIPPRPNRPPLLAYNTAVLIDAEGRVLGTYDKNVLLVFGEWVPLSHFLYRTFGFNFFAHIPSAGDITAGQGVTVMELVLRDPDGSTRRVRIGTMICYEDIIAEYGLKMAQMRPNIFVNIINDAWFQQSSAAYHHNAFAVMRAVEHRIPLIRSTNTGVSSIIDPVGRIVEETSLTGAETILADVPIMPPPRTLYSKIGDVVGWLAWLLVVGLAIRRRSAPDAPSDDEGERGAAAGKDDRGESSTGGSESRARSKGARAKRRGSKRRRR